MWLLHALDARFDYPIHDDRIQYYRVLIAVAVLLKTSATAFLGDWNRLRHGSFGRAMLDARQGAQRAQLISVLHKPLVVARLVAGVLLLVGIVPKLAIAVIVVGFLEELSYEYRFNTIYITLCLCCLAAAGSLGRLGHVSHAVSTSNTWAQFLIVLLTIDVYWNSAYQKLRSPQFVSGLSLVQQAYIARTVRPLMPGWEYRHPPVRATRAAAAGAVPAEWRAVAIGVIGLELVLPIGLLTPQLRPAAIVVGIALHLGFLGILPLRLAAFTVVTLASYILFVT